MGAPSYATYPPRPEEPSRPLGVAILAVLTGIIGVFFILAGVLLAVLGVSLRIGFPLGAYGVTIVGIIVLVIGLIILGVALGLWHQRMWALVLAILVFGLYFISNVVGGTFLSVGSILSLLLVIYLIAVHRHFL